MTPRSTDQVPIGGIIKQMNKWRDDSFYWKSKYIVSDQDMKDWRSMCETLKREIEKYELLK